MPELPEVEEVRRGLEPCLLGRRIDGVAVLRADFVTPAGAPLQRLKGRRFVQTLRHGKKLFLVADDGQTLLVHLGMTGQIACPPADVPRSSHTHVALALENGTEVRFRDPRRFGGLWYYGALREALQHEVEGKLGPDALTLEVGHLAHWRQTRGRLKARLLGQADVAGLGNIYVDEACWMAGLHPLQRVDRLRPQQAAALVGAIRAVLERSIKSGGTTLRDYRNVADQPGAFARQLQAYGRAGLPCARCGTALRKGVVAGRTTVFCGVCQRRR